MSNQIQRNVESEDKQTSRIEAFSNGVLAIARSEDRG